MQESAVQEGRYRLIRTLRVRNDNVPGVLGRLTTALGKADANIGNIQTVFLGQHHIERELDVLVEDQAHLDRLIQALSQLEHVDVLEVRDEVLGLHHGGKVRMKSRVPIETVEMLRKVYTPGVADVCLRIASDSSQRDQYTSIPNTVAIITDGTAVLGLGNIGPYAAMPVMEGKAALLDQLVGLSGVPILLATADPDEIVAAIAQIAPTFGGIQIEDVSAPRCFDVVKRLKEMLDIPVMHDDQDGTAAVVLGAVMTACRRVNIDMSSVVIGQIGLGAAGQAVADLLAFVTGNPVLGADINADSVARHQSRGGTPSTQAEIMEHAQIVIATTGVKGLIAPASVRPGQVILALSNPDPEIDPAVARERGAALAADGRSVNNALGYPGLWKGTLACGAREITRDMLIAAGTTLSGLASPTELLPEPLDRNAQRRVASAVAQTAARSGVAKRVLDEDYFFDEGAGR
jgi:malate dehydrogenase (oxaloacetate-decarboxylating)